MDEKMSRRCAVLGHKKEFFKYKIWLGILLAVLSVSEPVMAQSNTEKMYVGGSVAYNTLNDDGYFSSFNGKKDNKAVAWAILAGANLNSRLALEFEVSSHDDYTATGFVAEPESITLKNVFAFINVKRSFPMSNGDNWYIKPSLGMAYLQQNYHMDNVKVSDTDRIIAPRLVAGGERKVYFKGHTFYWYTEVAVSTYELKLAGVEESDRHQMVYSGFAMGVRFGG
jgi:hypothetical protein